MDKRILFITRTALKSDTSTGNTTEALFSFCKKDYCRNIYCRNEIPNINLCDSYFCISESELLNGICNDKEEGKVFRFEDINNLGIDETIEHNRYNFFKKYRSFIFLWARELVWEISKKKWQSNILRQYLHDFAPDILYMPIYDCFYMHKLLHYIKQVTEAKIVLYTGDDFYSYNCYNVSPMYYINQFILRKFIKKSILNSDMVLCFSDKQKILYSKIFKNKKICKIYKGYGIKNLSLHPVISFKKPQKLIYAGNLDYGRWKTLLMIGKCLDGLNLSQPHFELQVYTGSSLRRQVRNRIKKCKSILYSDAISYSELIEKQEKSDILLHIESFSHRDIKRACMSLSTKVVDYLFLSKPIISVGPDKVNSIKYLVDNNACLLAKSPSEIPLVFQRIINNQTLLNEYTYKAKELAIKNHNKIITDKTIQELIFSL